MLAQHAINLGILSTLFFVIGMIKPKWSLFFMEKPTRWHILIISTVFFMIVMTMYGEGVRQDKLKKKREASAAARSAQVPALESVPVPVPVPVPKESPGKK